MYLHENSLKKLPDEITCLSNLEILNLSNNALKHLPNLLGNLRNIRTLNIGNNKDLKSLPKSLGQAQKLRDLGVEGLNLVYPPKDIVSEGVVVAFLAQESGILYKPEEDVLVPNPEVSPKSPSDRENKVQVQRGKFRN